MTKKKLNIAILGLGEAGSCFANDLAEMGVSVVGYDPVPLRVLHPNVRLVASNPEAAAGSDIILSVNLAVCRRASCNGGSTRFKKWTSLRGNEYRFTANKKEG